MKPVIQCKQRGHLHVHVCMMEAIWKHSHYIITVRIASSLKVTWTTFMFGQLSARLLRFSIRHPLKLTFKE